MRKILSIGLSVMILIPIISCKKEKDNTNQISPITSMSELVVSDGFPWLAYDVANFTVNIQGGTNLEGQLIILYDDNFKTIEKTTISGGKAIFKSSIPSDNEFVNIFIPTTRAMLKVTDYTNISMVSMNSTKQQNMVNGSKMMVLMSPDCNSDCDETFSGTYSSLVISDKTACLTGSLNGTLTLSGNATLKICGTANISNINFNGNGDKTIIVTTFGSFQSTGINLNAGRYFENWSLNCAINGTFSVASDVYNYGTMSVNSMNINNNGYISNDGVITVSSSVNIGGTLYNYGTFQTGGSLQINQNTVENYCKMISGQSIAVNADMVNWGYMKATTDFTLNGADISMGYEAMISTQHLTLNGEIAGMNYLSAVKVSGITIINGSGSVTGVVNFCDANGIETNNGTMGSQVTYCQGYIELSDCNPEGIGLPQASDTDNDGVPDDLDDFPNDNTVAYENLSPYTGYKSVAFEDLWPSLGDFDFNDVMVKTKVRYMSNAQNILVKAQVQVVISALGAGLHNGLALQFLNNSNTAISGLYTSITGASVDPQESNSVLISGDLFNSQSSYYTNTSLSLTRIPDTLRFTIYFSTSGGGWEYTDLKEDFYIFRTGNRGLEIHVAGRPPSSAANVNLLCTGKDASNPSTGKYYCTSGNLPWGIEIIDEIGEYRNPLEKVEIIIAYPQFQQWAVSKGSMNKIWHKSPVHNKVVNISQ